MPSISLVALFLPPLLCSHELKHCCLRIPASTQSPLLRTACPFTMEGSDPSLSILDGSATCTCMWGRAPGSHAHLAPPVCNLVAWVVQHMD